MKPLRWGVIGAGGIVYRRTMAEGILPARNAQLAALMDCSAHPRATLRPLHGVAGVAMREELLALPLDAVCVATPAFEHESRR